MAWEPRTQWGMGNGVLDHEKLLSRVKFHQLFHIFSIMTIWEVSIFLALWWWPHTHFTKLDQLNLFVRYSKFPFTPLLVLYVDQITSDVNHDTMNGLLWIKFNIVTSCISQHNFPIGHQYCSRPSTPLSD